MIKTDIIKHITQTKSISETGKNVIEVVPNKAFAEFSKAASDSVSAIQKGLFAAKTKVLDFNSVACKFFGVDSPNNIERQLGNHLKLIELKCKHNKILDRFPTSVFMSLDNPVSINQAWCNIWLDYKGACFKYLYDKPARMTFSGKVFGKNGKEGFHTIGVLFHPESKTLYVLDSLPNSVKEVEEYQNILKDKVFNNLVHNKIEKIIFSSKPQQNLNEYTCNNWTFANIEALQKALKEGRTIDSVEKLNEVLPDDINKILSAQREFVLSN